MPVNTEAQPNLQDESAWHRHSSRHTSPRLPRRSIWRRHSRRSAKAEPWARLTMVEATAFSLLVAVSPLPSGSDPFWAVCMCLWLGLVAGSAMFLRRLWQEGEAVWPRTDLDWPILLGLIWSAVSIFWSIYPSATGWALARLALYCLVIYLTLDLVASRRRSQQVVILVVGVGSLVAFMGLVDFFAGGGMKNRLSGPFYNPDHAAGLMEMVFTFSLGMILSQCYRRPLVLWSCMVMLFVALVLTGSRGGWAGMFIGSLFIFVVTAIKAGRRWRMLIIWCLIISLGFGLVVFGSDQMFQRLEMGQEQPSKSLYSRMKAWSGAVEIAKESPLTGTGLGTFTWVFPNYRPEGLSGRWREAHNDYLQVVTELGIPVLIPILWGLIVIYGRLRSYFKEPSRLQSGIVLGALGAVTSILVHSTVDFNIQITSNGIMFALMIGLAMTRRQSSRSSRPQP